MLSWNYMTFVWFLLLGGGHSCVATLPWKLKHQPQTRIFLSFAGRSVQRCIRFSLIRCSVSKPLRWRGLVFFEKVFQCSNLNNDELKEEILRWSLTKRLPEDQMRLWIPLMSHCWDQTLSFSCQIHLGVSCLWRFHLFSNWSHLYPKTNLWMLRALICEEVLHKLIQSPTVNGT